MKRCLAVALLAMLAVLPLAAQAPKGWKVRADRSTSASDPDASGNIKFTTSGSGFHATNPQAAVFWNPANPGNASCVEEIKAATRPIGMQPRFLEVGDAKTLEQALSSVAREPPDAFVTCWDSVTLANAKPIADLALKLRLPTLAPLREYVQAGGLLSFGTSLSAHRRRAAYYVDKILKGAKPADLPVERPTLFELVVNLATAKSLGLALPPALVVLADDVVQ